MCKLLSAIVLSLATAVGLGQTSGKFQHATIMAVTAHPKSPDGQEGDNPTYDVSIRVGSTSLRMP